MENIFFLVVFIGRLWGGGVVKNTNLFLVVVLGVFLAFVGVGGGGGGGKDYVGLQTELS